MGFSEDDRIRKKNANVASVPKNAEQHTLIIGDGTLDKVLAILANNGLKFSLRDKVLIVSEKE